MRVVDTSVWIEWFGDTATAIELEPHLPSQEDCVVPTMVQLELAKWLGRERTTPLALLAAEMCRTHRVSTADAVIYATDVATDSGLLSCDAHFEGLERVVYVPKR